uniref:Uncharacterized protein n=1 Tax=Rhizophagus irregularis (strain DAOM 181602 / DAOM 197198 / MUCL 43194) TaxID=747089 RepID=U9SUM3_RHIID
MLTLLGITRQSGPQQYFNKQEEFFKVLWQAANISVENTLKQKSETVDSITRTT